MHSKAAWNVTEQRNDIRDMRTRQTGLKGARPSHGIQRSGGKRSPHALYDMRFELV